MIVKFLSGEKIYLRGLTREDCNEQYLSFVNDVEHLSYLGGIGYTPISVSQLTSYVESNSNSSNLLLGIFENNTHVHVGNVHLSQIQTYHQNCILGILINKDYSAKGYGKEATKLLIRHAFGVMNMHRIQISVVEQNINAIKLYESLGAVKEGILREFFYYNGKYWNLIVYSILQEEFYKFDSRV
jgi:RimJ/RimL family protein N-acetyltransferase